MARTHAVSNPKLQSLEQEGTRNAHPEDVADELFLEHDFFDPNDLLQVKYEMLRRVQVEGRSPTGAAEAFGFARISFYRAQDAFREGGLSGLLPRKRGPKAPHKLTKEVMDLILRALAQDESLHAGALVTLVEERLGLSVHRRSIERTLARRKRGRQ
jgi:transposase